MNKIFIIITFIFSATIYSSEVNDPFENINRKTFEFNENLDEKILKPTAKFYSKFPPLIKNGITNFFNNLEEVDTCVNQLLQGKPKKSANDLTRFLINSTVGLGGFIDVASTMGLKDMKRTLDKLWQYRGVGRGPYIMLPGQGLFNIRDTFSKPVSSFLSVTFHMTETDVNIALKSIDAIETRERLLDVESLLSGR